VHRHLLKKHLQKLIKLYIDIITQFLTKGYYQKDPNSPKIELNTGGIINNPDIEGNDTRLLTKRVITLSFMKYAW